VFYINRNVPSLNSLVSGGEHYYNPSEGSWYSRYDRNKEFVVNHNQDLIGKDYFNGLKFLIDKTLKSEGGGFGKHTLSIVGFVKSENGVLTIQSSPINGIVEMKDKIFTIEHKDGDYILGYKEDQGWLWDNTPTSKDTLDLRELGTELMDYDEDFFRFVDDAELFGFQSAP